VPCAARKGHVERKAVNVERYWSDVPQRESRSKVALPRDPPHFTPSDYAGTIPPGLVRFWLERFKEFLFPPIPRPDDCALVLSGGGARAAYQAGVLRYIAETFPDRGFHIIAGVSAGAINAAQLANHTGTFEQAANHLVHSWTKIRTEKVFEAESGLSMLWGLLRRGNGAGASGEEVTTLDVRGTHGLVDTTPLWSFLEQEFQAPDGVLSGIEVNLKRNRLKAAAVVTTNYATGQTVTWVQGKDFDLWERPDRISVNTTLSVDHVMASTSIPLIFPAVRIGDMWYGDGGVRLAAPLAPAVHLGADRIMAISTRYKQSRAEADEPTVQGYPPAAQIMGMLMNAIFMDALDQDAFTLQRINKLVEDMPQRLRHDMRPIQLLQIRPSVDLGRLASTREPSLPGGLHFLTSGLGTEETLSPDWLSVLLFEEDYVTRLLEIGYEDAHHQHDEIVKFFDGVAPFR